MKIQVLIHFWRLVQGLLTGRARGVAGRKEKNWLVTKADIFSSQERKSGIFKTEQWVRVQRETCKYHSTITRQRQCQSMVGRQGLRTMWHTGVNPMCQLHAIHPYELLLPFTASQNLHQLHLLEGPQPKKPLCGRRGKDQKDKPCPPARAQWEGWDVGGASCCPHLKHPQKPCCLCVQQQ